MRAAVWVVAIWVGLPIVFLLALCRRLSRELAKAEDDLQLAWQAGIMAGQILQAEREAEGL